MSHNPYCPPHSQGLWLGPPRLLAQGWESDSGLTQHDPHRTQHTPRALHASPAQLGSGKVAGPEAVDDSCLPTTSLNSSITTPPTSCSKSDALWQHSKGREACRTLPRGATCRRYDQEASLGTGGARFSHIRGQDMQKCDPALGSATRMGNSISHWPLGSLIPLFETPGKPPAVTAGRHISQAGRCRDGYVQIMWQHSSASFQGSRYICQGKRGLRCSQNSLP